MTHPFKKASMMIANALTLADVIYYDGELYAVISWEGNPILRLRRPKLVLPFSKVNKWDAVQGHPFDYILDTVIPPRQDGYQNLDNELIECGLQLGPNVNFPLVPTLN